MVTALEILESQMEDLVPSFGDMDTLIDGIADAFLYGGNKAEGFAAGFEDALNNAYSTLEESGTNFETFSEIVNKALDTGKLETWAKFGGSPRWVDNTTKSIEDVETAMESANREFGLIRIGLDEWDISGWTGEFNKVAFSMQEWARATYGVELSYEEVYALMKKPPEEQKKWLDDLMHSEKALTFQMDTQTDALKAQTDQLNKITNALKPYLDFMGTLESIAGMAELSTDDLNTGLNAITNTLSNLGTALTDFNLEGSMDALFGNAKEGEGAATAFITSLTAHMGDLSTLTGYIEMLTNSFTSLSNAFASIQEIETTKIAVENAVASIIRKVNSLISVIPSMFMYGANAILAFANGMRAYKSVLENELINIANMIEAYLGVASPTELGALKDIDVWPKNLVKSFASGIKSEMGTLNNSFSGMTLAAPGGGGGGSRTVITFNVTQNIKDKTTADYSTNSLERMLNRHEIM
jgi:CRISPR/Cas system CMR-associated protein Cmr5 small subunit